MNLINARELYTIIGQTAYLNVSALLALEPENLSFLFSSDSKITLKEVATAGQKQSHTFVNGAKQIIVRCEKVIGIKYNFNETDFDAGKKAIITPGGCLKLSGLSWQNKEIYFETDQDNVTIEIIELY